MAWTEERTKLLKKLWQSGKTTVEIGRMLGISKNAVVGKAHRLGLPTRPSPIKTEKKEAIKEKPKKIGHVTLMDLKLSSCRWPIGDPKEDSFHFCGAQTTTGKPYCPEHCKVAYTSLKELSLQNALNKNAMEQAQSAQAPSEEGYTDTPSAPKSEPLNVKKTSGTAKTPSTKARK